MYAPPSGVGPSLNLDLTSDIGLNINALSISISEIYRKLNWIDANKSPGFDGIPPRFLKECCFILSRPLWHIFNSSLSRGVFLTVWKNSIVTPVFKAGIHSDVRNYRPICKLSSLPKVFEAIVTQKLTPLLINVICEEQHGFVPGRSSETNLAVYHCYVSAALDKSLQVDWVFPGLGHIWREGCRWLRFITNYLPLFM